MYYEPFPSNIQKLIVKVTDEFLSDSFYKVLRTFPCEFEIHAKRIKLARKDSRKIFKTPASNVSALFALTNDLEILFNKHQSLFEFITVNKSLYPLNGLVYIGFEDVTEIHGRLNFKQFDILESFPNLRVS